MLRSVDSDNNQTEETNMSIENAILELAAAIRYAADKRHDYPEARASQNSKALSTIGLDNEMEKAVAKVETDAKTEQQKVMAKVEADRKPTTAKEAVADALARAKAEKEAALAPVDEPDPLLDEAPTELDYETDIKPRLIMLGKDKSALVALLAKYNAKKGTDIAKSDYAAVYHESGDLIAARG